jgi:hypothetical protein
MKNKLFVIESGIILGLTIVYLLFPQENVHIFFIVPFLLFGYIFGLSLSQEYYRPIGNKITSILMIFGSSVLLSGIAYLLQRAIFVKSLFSGYLLFLGSVVCLIIVIMFLLSKNISLLNQRIYHDESL